MNARACTLSIIILLFGNVESAVQAPDDRTLELVKENTEKKDLYFYYLLATYQHAHGDAGSSLKTYKQLIKNNPSPHAYGDLFQLLSDTGQFKTITALYESKVMLFNNALSSDIQVQLNLAQAYLNTGKNTDSENIFTHLATKYPDNEHVAYFSTLAYIKNNQFDKAHKLIDTCLANPTLKQKHFLFYFLRSKILIHQNKLTQALACVEKSLELFPRFDHGWLFRSMLLEQLGRVSDAISGYKKFLDLVGDDEEIEKQLVQLLFTQQRFDEALTYLKRIKTHTPGYFFDRALLEVKTGNTGKALTCLEKSLELSPTFTKARLLKIEILLNNKRIDDLMCFIREWINEYPDDQAAVHSLLLLRKANVALPRLIQTLQEIEKNKQHNNVNILSALADLASAHNDAAMAIRYYNKVITATKDPELKSKAFFHIGYIHFKRKENDKLEHALRAAIKYSPAYPSAFNLLAYHYALTNQHLEEALLLSEQALEQVPQCAYYLDTKGYVLLKSGKNKDAAEMFKQALQQTPNDAIILEHLKQAQGSLPR
jgi:tetratricopeptide (TPR) repeat protein